MSSLFLLLEISFAPAPASVVATLPIWRARRLRIETIHTVALIEPVAAMLGNLFPVLLPADPYVGFPALVGPSLPQRL